MIRNFLFSTANREFLIFLFFLALSGIFWLMLALNDSYDMEVKVPLRIINVPKNIVLSSDEVDTVKVTVHDKGFVLAAYYKRNTQTVKVNFNSFTRRNGILLITNQELQKLIGQRLYGSTKIVSVKPEKLEYYYSFGTKKKVPVRWSGHVVPEGLYYISNVTYMPDSVTIYASKEKLDSITTVYTQTLNYSNFRDTLVVDEPLRKIVGVKMVPDHVQLSFFTDVLTEESIDGVLIRGINMPEGKVLRTFPGKVRVRFVAGASLFRKLKPSDFQVVADYKDIKAHPAEKCRIYLRSYPPGITRVELQITEVDYLIEEKWEGGRE